MGVFRLVIAGVGGQGTLLASRLIAQSAIDAGLPVKIGETYGMAQRGGPVMGHIQIGEGAESSQIRPGEADVLLGFEIGEAVRQGVQYLKDGGLALVNLRKFPPVEVISGMMEYPSEDSLLSLLKEVTSDIITFDATAIAEKAGDAISTNMVMLGATVESGKLPFDKEIVIAAMRNSIRATYLETNLSAFKMGQAAYMNYSK
ncbi:MAG: indolepyruvate oxidoreductase subunit beta [Candidatus Bathyarchaeota archaeon]|jgi:indolepyruvate ferredoxin oxidoreductase beta subunit|nr:indolepyruvate oxidoreductase subunit beta [Candidatus Bathyarchaeota archaeon]MDP7207965.1 indolepyruvate oxidoreductase subunit beta [Candidatus Bathyarchaeota archaeon]